MNTLLPINSFILRNETKSISESGQSHAESEKIYPYTVTTLDTASLDLLTHLVPCLLAWLTQLSKRLERYFVALGDSSLKLLIAGQPRRGRGSLPKPRCSSFL